MDTLRTLAMSAWVLATGVLWAQSVSAAVATLPQNVPTQQLKISAPTQSLTAIVNNMMMRSRSLNIAFMIAPNLPVSRPVYVSVSHEVTLPGKLPERVGYLPPQRYGANGVGFYWSDIERDRQPRKVKMNVHFAEHGENGTTTAFAYTYDVVLEPVYDVELGDLTYHLLENCDGGALGRNSETKISVGRPDGSRLEGYETLPAGERRFYPQFRWAGKELKRSQLIQLYDPDYVFFEMDCYSVASCLRYEPQQPHGNRRPLFRALTERPRRVEVNEYYGNRCRARFTHDIVFNLRNYERELQQEILSALSPMFPKGGRR